MSDFEMLSLLKRQMVVTKRKGWQPDFQDVSQTGITYLGEFPSILSLISDIGIQQSGERVISVEILEPNTEHRCIKPKRHFLPSW